MAIRNHATIVIGKDDQENNKYAKLISQLNVKGESYEVEDAAARSAIDTLNGNDSTEGSVLKSIKDALSTHDSGKTLLVSDNDQTIAQEAGNGKLISKLKIGSNGKFAAETTDLTTGLVKRTATAAVTTGTKQIALSGATTEAALVELAQAMAAEIDARTLGDSTLLGASTDTESAMTLYGIKKYAHDLVQATVGADPDTVANIQATINQIVNELKTGGEDTTLGGTLLDNFVTQIAALGNASEAVLYEEGDEIPEGKQIGDVKTEAVAHTIKTYVDAKVDSANSSTDAAIANLDATVNSTGGSHVAVQVVEEDGKVQTVTVTETNFDYEHITGADNKTLKKTLEDRDQTVSAALTELDGRLDVLEGSDSTSGSVAKSVKDAVQALNAEVTSTDGKNIQVKVTEVDGKVTGVNITTDNTINSTDLSNAIGKLGNKSENTPYTNVKDYVDTQVANSSTNLAVSATGDDYVNAAVDANNNKKIDVSATSKTTAAIAAAETSIQTLKVNNVDATITGNDNAKAAAVTINGTNITVGGNGTHKDETVQAAVESLQTSISNLDNTYATDTDVDNKIDSAKSELKGTKASGDTTDETIRGAKDYADAKAAAATTIISTVDNSGVSINEVTPAVADGHKEFQITLNVQYSNGVLTIA